MLEPALQVASCHLGGPPPVRQLQQEPRAAGETANQMERSQRAISSCTGFHWQGQVVANSIKDRPQDGKGNVILGSHLTDAIRLHIDR